MNIALQGVVHSLPMFFQEDDSPDFSSLERYLELLQNSGETKLIYPMAYNTRIAYLSEKNLVELHNLVSQFCKSYNLSWVVVPPYKASGKILHDFFEKLSIDENVYAASILFPERFYGLDDKFIEYFAIPNKFGIKTLIHEMKMISGLDGSLIDWPANTISEVINRCEVAGLKEDSKNDMISEYTLSSLNIDVIMAGGGVTQINRLISSNPKCWLSGVSLVFPMLTKAENRILKDTKLRNVFIENIEKPFFEMCSKFGWHRVHKGLLHLVHQFPKSEPDPMSELSSVQIKVVNDVWNETIFPEIENVLRKC